MSDNEYDARSQIQEDLENQKDEKNKFVNKKVPKKIVILYMVFLLIFTCGVVFKVESNKMSGLSTYAEGPLFDVVPTGDSAEKIAGKYYAPTITIREVSNFEVVRLKLMGKPLLSNKKKPGTSLNFNNYAVTLDMEASKRNALAAAVASSGGLVSQTNVVINNLDEAGPAFQAGLRVGMSIIEVNGTRINDPSQFIKIENKNNLLTIKTLQKNQIYRVRPVNNSIGATLITTPTGKLPNIDIRLDKVGGASAGLIMAIAFYDALTPGEFTSLRKVSGSGQITAYGQVAPIEGINEKLASAEEMGVQVFFVSDKQKYKFKSKGMIIVPVSNLEEALAYLRSRK